MPKVLSSLLARLRRTGSGNGSEVGVALCAWPDRYDVVRIGQGAAQPRVEQLDSYQREGAEVEALKRIGRRHGLGRYPCITLLGGADYQLRQIEIPPNAGAEQALRVQLAEALRGALDQPLEHVGYDAVRIPTREFAPGRAEQAYVVVAGNAAIAPRVQAFHAAGVNLQVIDIPEMAQRNVAALCETPGRALALLSFDLDGGLLTFTCNGELYMSRHLEVGARHMNTDDLDRRSTLFDRIGLELQRSLDNFDRQFGFLPLGRVLLGPMAQALPLQGYLRDYLGVTVDVLDLADILDIARVPELKRPERQGECLLSLGAALRSNGGEARAA